MSKTHHLTLKKTEKNLALSDINQLQKLRSLTLPKHKIFLKIWVFLRNHDLVGTDNCSQIQIKCKL